MIGIEVQVADELIKIAYEMYRNEKRKLVCLQKKAYSAMNKAIRKGELVRPIYCEECGILDSGLEGHHEDYSQPLNIEWLCSKCYGTRLRTMDMAFFRLANKLGPVVESYFAVAEGAD